MSNIEQEPAVFDIVNHRVVVNPERISGFQTDKASREVVSDILSRTFEGVLEHGASALGLDLDSMFGRIHASDTVRAVVSVGGEILDDVAARVDDTSWKQWIAKELPNVVSALYGPESDIHKFAEIEMEQFLA